VLVFFPVPPFTRQAAGPLIENLPNVLTGDRITVGLSSTVTPSLKIKLRFSLHERSVVFVAQGRLPAAGRLRPSPRDGKEWLRELVWRASLRLGVR
jgi:hypothetical protein